jgi:hypothetical protein
MRSTAFMHKMFIKNNISLSEAVRSGYFLIATKRAPWTTPSQKSAHCQLFRVIFYDSARMDIIIVLHCHNSFRYKN